MAQRRRSGVSDRTAITHAAQVAKSDVLMALSRLEDAAPWASGYPILHDLLYSEDDCGNLLSLMKLLNRAREEMNQIILLTRQTGEGE